MDLERISMSAGGDSSRVIFIALMANLGIAIAKFIGAFLSGSAALLAEAIHSFVDCSNQVLLLIGNKLSKQPPSEQYPLGRGREAFFWSFIVAVLLFSLGGLFAIYEGIHKLDHEDSVSSPILGIAILLVAIVLEGYSFLACIKEVRTQNSFGTLWKWLRKTTSSELLVVFTEDAAALLGLLVAISALIASWATGNSIWDAMGSIAVGVILVAAAIFLAIEIKSLIIGEVPATDFSSYVRERVSVHIPDGQVFKLIALQTGIDEVLMSCKISAGSITQVDLLLEAINKVEKEIKEEFPEVKWLFMEPDLRD